MKIISWLRKFSERPEIKEEVKHDRRTIHIKKNDLIMVTRGKKGKSGRVLKVLPEKES